MHFCCKLQAYGGHFNSSGSISKRRASKRKRKKMQAAAAAAAAATTSNVRLTSAAIITKSDIGTPVLLDDRAKDRVIAENKWMAPGVVVPVKQQHPLATTADPSKQEDSTSSKESSSDCESNCTCKDHPVRTSKSPLRG